MASQNFTGLDVCVLDLHGFTDCQTMVCPGPESFPHTPGENQTSCEAWKDYGWPQELVAQLDRPLSAPPAQGQAADRRSLKVSNGFGN